MPNAQLNSRYPGWLPVCRSSDVARRRARKLSIGGVKIAVFRTSHGALLAVEDRCPHRGGPLSEGLVSDQCVTCPLHGWKIDLVTGGAKAPDQGRVATFGVFEEDGYVFLKLPIATSDLPLVTIEERTGVHPDNKRPKLGRRRATHVDFTPHDFSGEVPVLAVEPPSPTDEQSHRLEMTLLSGRRRTLTLAELRARYHKVLVPTHVTCLMFGFTHAVKWHGVRLADVVADINDEPFSFASFYSWDTQATQEDERFFETLPREYVEDPRTLLVFGMGDERLPRPHGGPLRLVVPFLQGYKSVKWLSWIKLTAADEIGYKKKHGFIEFPEFVPPVGWQAPWNEP